MSEALLDTDILADLILFRNSRLQRRVGAYTSRVGPLTFSAVTRYAVLCGFKEKNAAPQLSQFLNLCQYAVILPITERILDRASDLWAIAQACSSSCNDADLIIAATALESDRVLITGNHSQYSWIPELQIKDWRGR